jgi:WD40 repeat protein
MIRRVFVLLVCLHACSTVRAANRRERFLELHGIKPSELAAGGSPVYGVPIRQRQWTVSASGFAFSPDSRRLAFTGGGKLIVVDVASGDTVLERARPGGMSSSLAFSPSGLLAHDLWFMNDNSDRRLHVVDLGSGREVVKTGLYSPIKTLRFDTRGTLAVGFEEGRVERREPATLEIVERLPGTYPDVIFDPAGRPLVWGQFPNPAYTLPAGAVKPVVLKPVADNGRLYEVDAKDVAPDGTIATASDPWLILFAPDGRKVSESFLASARAGRVRYTPDGQNLAVGLTGRERGLRLVDPATGKTVAVISQDSSYTFEFSPDGRYLASTHEASKVQRVVLYDFGPR